MVEYAVVLAVGNLHHQSQLTYNRPRAMLPATGKSLLVRAMDLLYRAGIQHFVVVIGEDEGAAASYLTTHWVPNVTLEFVIQSANSSLTRTMADIARQHTQPFIITSYNTFVQANFPERLLHRYSEAKDSLVLSGALMSLSQSTNHYYALPQDQIIRQITSEPPSNSDEKPLILSNMAVCGQPCVDFLKGLSLTTQTFTRQWLELANLYVQRGGTVTVADASWILQIENDHDLLTLNRLLLDEVLDAHILSDLPGTVHIIPPVRIDPQVSIGQGAIIGPHVYLESGCSVGQGATVQRSIVLQNAIIPAREVISDMIVASKIRIPAPGQTT
ncbi:MAG: NDP-sugar synthase [Anaerolineae bacterium]|nr:NDP-sugar synthase [Anaerolineae bacterium]